MAKYRSKLDIVEAEQFIPHSDGIEGFVSWSKAGYQPRDMSWGYVQGPHGKLHVMANNWIVTNSKGEKSLFIDEVFKLTFEVVEDNCK